MNNISLASTELRTPDVDLGGLFDLLGQHLYSTPIVAIRELVQNAHDSIVRRRLVDPSFTGGTIRLVANPDRGMLSVEDNGAGLTADEIVADLATIGSGGTRGAREASGSDELIGLFGIGFLSAFVVSDAVVVTTTSWREPDRGWRYRSAGGQRYSLDEVAPRAAGSTVALHLRPDTLALADAGVVRRVVARYAALLRVPVFVGDDPEPINATAPPWRNGPEQAAAVEHPVAARRRRLDFAAHFEPAFRPICTIDVIPSGGSDAAGLLWVQDGATYGSSDNRHVSVFCRGMLVDDDARDLLPRWAGFCGAVIESNGLSPTASREDIRKDESWEAVRAAVAERLIAGFADVARHQPEAWRRVLVRHNEALLGAALTDDRLFELLCEHLTIPTTLGDLTARAMARQSGGSIYVSQEERGGFEEMVCRAQGIPVASGIRYGVAPFLRRWAHDRHVTLVELGTADGDRRLFRPATLDPDALARLAGHLAGPDEAIVPARFAPASLPLVPVLDREAELKRRVEDDEADGRMAAAGLRLARLHTATIAAGPPIRLYVNLDNPVVQALAEGRGGPPAKTAATVLRAIKALVSGSGRSATGPLDDVFADLTASLDSLLVGEGSAMDVWAWVTDLKAQLREEGAWDFANGIRSLSRAVLDGDHDEVDAAVPALLAEARARRLPWVEVFVRHWHLQSRAVMRAEGGAVLNDAVDAFERAHAPEAAGCPQAVCTVQDLCIAYANVDGPGFAGERLAVTAECLAKIDPTWNCYTCIIGERASALIDGGSGGEAVALLERAQIELTETGYKWCDDEFRANRVEAYLTLGRPGDALQAVERAERRPHGVMGAVEEVERRLDRAIVLAHLGRGTEAAALLPPPEQIQGRRRAQWAETVGLLVETGAVPNEADLGRVILAWAEERLRAGSARHAFTVATVAADLAIARGRRWAAQRAVAFAVEAGATLRDPEEVRSRLDTLTAAASAVAAPDVSGWSSPFALAESNAPDDDEMFDVDLWLAAAARWPDDDHAAARAAWALAAAASVDEAATWLLDWIRRQPAGEGPVYVLVDLLAAGDEARAEEAAEELEARLPAASMWLRARVASRSGRYRECVTWCQRLVHAVPEALNARRLWAGAAGRLGEWDVAVSLLGEVLAATEEEEQDDEEVKEHRAADHWRRMVAATIVGRWDLVRASCASLGIETDSESGAIDEVWHPVILSYPGGETALALRTGPVTARVLSVAPPGKTQRADDVVVFEPSPLEEAPDEPDEDWFPTYEYVSTLLAGDRVAYEVVVVEPDDAVLEGVRERLTEAGARWWIVSDSDATCSAPDSEDEDDELAAVAALVAVPPELDPSAVDAILSGAWGEKPDPSRPAVWPALAAAAGDAAMADLHRSEWERWEFG